MKYLCRTAQLIASVGLLATGLGFSQTASEESSQVAASPVATHSTQSQAAKLTFSSHSQGCGSSCEATEFLHADLNHDGREDLIWPDEPVMGVNGSFEVQLSTGDGTWAKTTDHYQVPQGSCGNFINAMAIGDFNQDGQADLAIAGADGNIYLYLNTGSGKLTLSKSVYRYSPITGPCQVAGASAMQAADFNRDGHTDLAVYVNSQLHILLGNGKGGFTAGPVSDLYIAVMALGDFDGDGNIDLASWDLGQTVSIFYGDGKGHFPQTVSVTVPGSSAVSYGDANSDGLTDILVTPFSASAKAVDIYYGNTARTFASHTAVPLKNCGAASASVADLDGNGINDLIVPEQVCGSNTGSESVGVLTRNSNGSYNADETIYTSPEVSGVTYQLANPPWVIRGNADTKPDLLLQQCTSDGCVTYDTIALLNTSSGSFPTCAAPNAYEGIHVCAPTSGATVSSPVSFQVGAAGATTMRDVEVWIDGQKEAEPIDGFSNYTFLNKSLSLAAGSHKVSIYAAGWDQSTEKQSYTIDVK